MGCTAAKRLGLGGRKEVSWRNLIKLKKASPALGRERNRGGDTTTTAQGAPANSQAASGAAGGPGLAAAAALLAHRTASAPVLRMV